MQPIGLRGNLAMPCLESMVYLAILSWKGRLCGVHDLLANVIDGYQTILHGKKISLIREQLCKLHLLW